MPTRQSGIAGAHCPEGPWRGRAGEVTCRKEGGKKGVESCHWKRGYLGGGSLGGVVWGRVTGRAVRCTHVGAAGHHGERAVVVGGARNARRDGAVEGGIDRLFHGGLPGVRGVVGDVDGAGVGDHLGGALAGPGKNADGRAWELGGERDAVPAGAAIRGVEQDGGLADNPALLAREGDGVEAVVEALLCNVRNVGGGGRGRDDASTSPSRIG